MSENNRTRGNRCPGCARMCRIHPCFPGCSGQRDSAAQSTACCDLKSDPLSPASEAVPLGFGLRAEYVLGARAAPTATMPIGQVAQGSARAPKRVDGDGEPLPVTTTPPQKEVAA